MHSSIILLTCLVLQITGAAAGPVYSSKEVYSVPATQTITSLRTHTLTVPQTTICNMIGPRDVTTTVTVPITVAQTVTLRELVPITFTEPVTITDSITDTLTVTSPTTVTEFKITTSTKPVTYTKFMTYTKPVTVTEFETDTLIITSSTTLTYSTTIHEPVTITETDSVTLLVTAPATETLTITETTTTTIHEPVTITETDSVTLLVPVPTTETFTITETTTTTVIPVSTCTTPAQLIRNPSFEQETTTSNWLIDVVNRGVHNDIVRAWRETPYPADNSFMLRTFTDTVLSYSTGHRVYQAVRVCPGTKYNFQMKLRTTAESRRPSYAQVLINWTQVFKSTAISSQTWTTFQGTWTAGGDTDTGLIQIIVTTDPGDSSLPSYLAMDELSLIPAA